MKFTTQKMDESSIQEEKLYKQIEKALDGLEIVRVDDNYQRKFKIPATNLTAIVYDLVLTDGSEIELYVLKDGTVGRISFNGHAGGDKTFASIAEKDEKLGTTVNKVANEILRAIKAENLKEQKGKINKRSMDKLLDEVAGAEDSTELQQLKEDLTKGSGKYIVLNEEDEFYSTSKGWTLKNSEIQTFNSLEDAKKVKDLKKVVQL